jgi:Na+/H+-dicarboxylate symporter
LFALLLLASAITAALLGPLLLGAWSPPAGALDGLRASLGGGEMPPVPPASEWVSGLIPTNVVAAAAEGAIVQLTLFALLFGIAVSRLPEERRAPFLAVFQAVADTVLVIVRWVLLLAAPAAFHRRRGWHAAHPRPPPEATRRQEAAGRARRRS